LYGFGATCRGHNTIGVRVSSEQRCLQSASSARAGLRTPDTSSGSSPTITERDAQIAVGAIAAGRDFAYFVGRSAIRRETRRLTARWQGREQRVVSLCRGLRFAALMSNLTIDMDSGGVPRRNAKVGDDAYCSKNCLQWTGAPGTMFSDLCGNPFSVEADVASGRVDLRKAQPISPSAHLLREIRLYARRLPRCSLHLKSARSSCAYSSTSK